VAHRHGHRERPRSLGPCERPLRGGVGPAFTFALACELVAVAATCVPLAAVAAFVAWRWTHDLHVVGTILALTVRVAAVFIP